MSTGRRGWTSQLKERENVPFPQPFVLLGASRDWMMPAHISEGDLMYSVY